MDDKVKKKIMDDVFVKRLFELDVDFGILDEILENTCHLLVRRDEEVVAIACTALCFHERLTFNLFFKDDACVLKNLEHESFPKTKAVSVFEFLGLIFCTLIFLREARFAKENEIRLIDLHKGLLEETHFSKEKLVSEGKRLFRHILFGEGEFYINLGSSPINQQIRKRSKRK